MHRLAPLALLVLAACGADGPPLAPAPAAAVPDAAGAVAEDRALRPAGAVGTDPVVTVSGEARAGVVFAE